MIRFSGSGERAVPVLQHRQRMIVRQKACCYPLALLCILLSTGLVNAQTTRVLTLQEAVEIARSQAVTVQQAELDVAASNATVAGARASHWPGFNLYSAGSQRYGLAFDQTAGQLTQQTTEYAESGLSASWIVFDGLARQARIAGAVAGRDAARLRHARADQAAVYETLRRYYGVATAAAMLGVVRSNVEAQERQLAVVKAQIDAGLRPESELYLQQERLADAELRVLEAERNLRSGHLQMLRHLALDPTGDYEFPQPEPLLAPAPAPEAVLVETALETRADLRAFDAAVTAARAEHRAARASRWPMLTIIGNVGTTYTSSRDTPFASQLGDNRRGTVGLNIGLPLLDGGQRSAQARLADVRLRQMEIEAADHRRVVAVEVLEVVRELDVRQQELEVAERRVRAAASFAEAERYRYQHGVSTLAAVAEASARLVEAEVQRAEARNALAVTRVLLDYRTGRME
jgi:outer membrane protein